MQSNIEIKKIELIDFNKIKVFIIAFEILKPKAINDLKNDFFKKLNSEYDVFLEIKYELRDELSDYDLLLEYKENLEYHLHQKCSISKLCNFSADEGDLIVQIQNDGYKIITKNNAINRFWIKNGALLEVEQKVQNELGKVIKIDIDHIKEVISIDEYLKSKGAADKVGTELKSSVISAPDFRSQNIANNLSKETKKESGFATKISGDSIPISSLMDGMKDICVTGRIISISTKEIKDDLSLMIFVLYSGKDAIHCKKFFREEKIDIAEQMSVKLSGDVSYDTFMKSMCVNVKKIQEIPQVLRKDIHPQKRVELHCHTNMSSSDAIPTPEALLKMIKDFGYEAVAVTDHRVVQAFPDLMKYSKKLGVKVIYGCEFSMVDDMKKHIDVNYDLFFDDKYIVFDLETTGLSNITDNIIEIGAVKIEKGEITGTFSELIDPKMPIPENITRITGINDGMVIGKPEIDIVLKDFVEFCGEGVLVAHNADFDTGFIRTWSEKLQIDFEFSYIDTLAMSRAIMTHLKNHKLDTIANDLNVSLVNHHRAIDDATATAEIFLKFLEMLKIKGLKSLNEMNDVYRDENIKNIRPVNVTVLAKNQAGLKDLYEMVSESHVKHLYRFPLLPKSTLDSKRSNLLVGSSDSDGEIFDSALGGKSKQALKSMMGFYDYIEIMPASNHMHLVGKKVESLDDIRGIYKKIVSLAKSLGKIVVAVSDAHYLNEDEQIFRKVLKASMKRKEEYPEDELFLRTTGELLDEFSYFGEEEATEYVIENSLKINDMIDDVLPIPQGTFPPIIEGSDKQLRDMCFLKARQLYSENLPDIIQKRLEKELDSIISNGYAVMYIIAHKLVKKSNDDGYIVGSRGSVGSSLAATMSGITEVNPLPPHYRCPNCKHSDFDIDEKYKAGPDLPDKECPNCGEKYLKDGFDIPFEVFLGFEGDKEPDIDLNFAGEYQPKAHAYVQELFGADNVFRAGTIGTIAEKTAFGYVKKYEEESGNNYTPAQVEVLKRGTTGIKRTTGQHPGGIMVVPDYKDIHDFSPINYPANEKDSGVLTTHFDYHSISENILKLDILGHDGPSMLKQLENLTGNKDVIPLDDKKIMSIFTSTDALECSLDAVDCKVGTLGIPEFGTRFVRQMLMDTKPTTFGELVRISGLSHGTNVWTGNAQELVKNGTATLKEIISTRDDIMNYLISMELEPKTAFTIMERVRKGKGLKDEHIEDMKNHRVPAWYIDSCQKIQYMFPKAHAAAYVTLSFQVAYYKVYFKEAFYATHFTTKVAYFDIGVIKKGKQAILDKLEFIKSLGNDATEKEKNTQGVLEIAYEMYERGVEILAVDLYTSHKNQFLLTKDNKILPPLMAVPGLGSVVADKIYEEARKKEFISIEDFKNRTGASKTVIDILIENGILEGMSETNQLTFDVLSGM